MGNRNGYLTNRDRSILAFVYRYRAATEDLLQRGLFPVKQRRSNVSRVVRRLLRRGLLNKTRFAPDRHYIVLTRRGCRALGVPERVQRPFTEQSLPAVLAIGWYCVRNGVARFTDREFRERYPDLWKPGLRSSSYYLTETPHGMKLGMFVIDRGGTPRRIKGKIRRLIKQRDNLPAFDALIRCERFRITILTGLPAQQQNIRKHIKRLSFRHVEIEVVVVAELGDLLTQE